MSYTIKAKRQPIDWVKTFGSHVSNKDLTPLTQQQQNIQFKNGPKELFIHVSKDDMQLASKHMKQRPAPTIIREIQIRNTVEYHITYISMTSNLKNKQNGK